MLKNEERKELNKLENAKKLKGNKYLTLGLKAGNKKIIDKYKNIRNNEKEMKRNIVEKKKDEMEKNIKNNKYLEKKKLKILQN